MIDKKKIAGILIKEGSPVIIDMWKNHVVEENMERTRIVNEEYFDKAKKLSNAPTKKESNHGEECATCGRSESLDLDIPELPHIPHGETGDKDPHYDYTMREMAKHLALIQNHFTDYRCPDCTKKHALIIEGLAEEGVPMTTDADEKERFQRVIKWSKGVSGRTDYDALIDESREIRTSLTGVEHADDEFDNE